MLQKIKKQFKEGKTLLMFGFLRTTGQGLGMIAPLIVAKFFSPALFGSYSLAKMVVFFFISLLISSAQTPFIVFANQERAVSGKINKSFSVQCTFLAFSIAAFAVLVLLFGKAITAFAKISFSDLLFVYLAFIGIAIQTFLTNLLMALGERMKNAAFELVFGSSVLVLVLILYFTNKISVGSVFLIYFLAAIPLAVLLPKTVELNLLAPFVFDRDCFKKTLNFTKWLMFGSAAVYFINWGDNLVLRPFVSMEDIGDYNLGYQFFKGVVVLTTAVSAYFLPVVSQQIEDSRAMKGYLFDKRPKIFLLGFVGIGLLFIICPSVLRFLYGDIYRHTIVVFRILLIGSVMILYNTFYYSVFNALKKYKFVVTVNIVQVFLNIALNLLLIPRFGATGAATATILAYFCATVIYEIYFRIELKKTLGL